jgi:hypothetical protein
MKNRKRGGFWDSHVCCQPLELIFAGIDPEDWPVLILMDA